MLLRAVWMQGRAGIRVDGAVGPQTWNATFATGRNGGSLNGSYHAAAAHDSRVEPNTYTGSGAVKGRNRAYQAGRLRVESWTHFPDGTSKAAAERSARIELARHADPGWTGTITLTVDPREGSRLRIKEGQGITVLGHRGVARRFHIASVAMDLDASPYRVVLTVDTQARDAMTLAAIAKRARDAKDLRSDHRARNRVRRRLRRSRCLTRTWSVTSPTHPFFLGCGPSRMCRSVRQDKLSWWTCGLNRPPSSWRS